MTYNPPAAGIGAWFATTSTDAYTHSTVYSSNFAGQVVKVSDALGHSRKATFNANADQLTAVDAVGVGRWVRRINGEDETLNTA